MHGLKDDPIICSSCNFRSCKHTPHFVFVQGHLIEALKAVYLRLSGAREQFEKQLERKQKSVARYVVSPCVFVCGMIQ